jgi:hypothetical protein
MTSEMMTSRSLICLLENQNGGKLQKNVLVAGENHTMEKKIEILFEKIVFFLRFLSFL